MLDGRVPREVFELALVLFLSFLVGIEREEHKAEGGHYVFGGIRTFPLLGFVGYGLARLSGGDVISLAIGFAVVGGLMAVSYWNKVRADPGAGATTEVSALLTYLLGALVHAGAIWTAVALGIIAVLLLELREGLAKLTSRIARDEVLAFAKFLLLAVVILPVLPDRPFGAFAINPFRTWLVVVAVSGLSYASYLLQKWLRQRGGVLVTALLGGAYSSTATTIVLAREAKSAGRPSLYAGSALAASGVMYLRILLLVSLFDPALARSLAPWFSGLGLVAIGGGIGAALANPRPAADRPQEQNRTRNPLELRPAFLFGVAFLAMLVLSQLALRYVGRAGLYGMATVMGFGDVDPFVLGIAQGSPLPGAQHGAAAAVVIATSANDAAKAAYARVFAGRDAGRPALLMLLALAVAGILPVFWFLQS
ncbi:MAG TPA: MgtC/SapB family protein [Polyangiaceae bacterium]